VVERERRDAVQRDELRGGGVAPRAEGAAGRSQDEGDGERVTARIAPRIAVHAQEADDLRLEPGFLAHLAPHRVLQALAELDPAPGEGVPAEKGRAPPLHEDHPPTVEQHGVDRHTGHGPSHGW
jgi:hypothetical protein